MITPLRRFGPLMLISLSILLWIWIIGVVLWIFLGSEVATRWLITSGFFSAAGLCVLVLVKEIFNCFVVTGMHPLGERFYKNKSFLRTNALVKALPNSGLSDASALLSRRAALGLSVRVKPLNRHRHSSKRVEPIFANAKYNNPAKIDIEPANTLIKKRQSGDWIQRA